MLDLNDHININCLKITVLENISDNMYYFIKTQLRQFHFNNKLKNNN